MATPWDDPIKKTKTLTVFPGSSVSGGSWASVFASAIQEFNNLSNTHKLGVSLSQSATAPDPSGVGGADVQFEAGNGTVNFTSFGQTISVTVNGDALGGDTQQVKLVTTLLNSKRYSRPALAKLYGMRWPGQSHQNATAIIRAGD